LATAIEMKTFYLLILQMLPLLCAAQVCDIANKGARFDCFPDSGPSQSACESRGCCWNTGGIEKASALNVANKLAVDVPFCYFPKDYSGYTMISLQETDYGYIAKLSRTTSSGWPIDIKELQLNVWFETSYRVHFKITDPATQRYEVPIVTPPLPSRKPSMLDFDVQFTKLPFGLTVVRKSTGAVLFDTTVAPLIFADQFIQLSSRLSTELLYGLGEHKATLLHNASSWQRLALWAKDQGPRFNTNLYGSHPFYLNVENDGKVHGAFLLNSNAMDIDIQPLPAVTFRTIGGVLDFYLFVGPTATDVVSQYTEVIGRPQMPPYWALGFHLCRYNYNSAQRLKEIIARNRAIKIPYDVQWSDIDYMDAHMDWTYDQNAYMGLPDIVKDLHNFGQKYVIIVDPGISNQRVGKYKPYDSGLAMGVFIRNASNVPLVGQVWPGQTVFPDFTHPNVTEWWYNSAKDYHDVVPFDGLWTDMNEPSNFVSGSVSGCTNDKHDAPPYVPAISGKLQDGTVCPSAIQYLSTHYNLHNMYGLTEANATNRALRKLLNQRSIVISRSSYPSQGVHGGHWTGDISSTWEDLYYSIPAILEFQFYGVPLVGADICGFSGNTTEELCTRWMQLGAFYPFMRNHNDDVSRDQDPAAWSPIAQQAMKVVLEMR